MMSEAQTKEVVSTAAEADIVRLMLTSQQAAQIAPMLERASACERNVLFVAAAVPFWRDGALVWEWQLTLIPAKIGHKIVKLIRPWKGGAGQ
jgi:hypothetical protein